MALLDEHGIPVSLSLTDFVFAGWEKHADKYAYIDSSTNEGYTYRELWDNILRISGALWECGWRTGDVVCLYAEACLEFPLFFYAAAKIGLIVSPVNSSFTSEELLRVLNLVQAKWLVISSSTLNQAKSSMKKYDKIQGLLVLNEVDGYLSIKTILNEEQAPFPEVTFDPKTHLVLLSFTSGTTGLPKAVMHSHYTMIAATCAINGMGKEEGSETVLTTVPHFGLYGILYAFYMSMHKKFKVIILPKYTMEGFLSAIEKFKVTLCYIKPNNVVALSKTTLLDKYNLSSVKDAISSGSPLSSTAARVVMDRLPHVIVRQIYGLTELPPVTDPAPQPLQCNGGSIGTPLKRTQFKVVDIETRKPLNINEAGELLLRGPHLFLGYCNNPISTAAAFEEGWFKTGDEGYQDQNGFCYVTGRVKDILKVGIYQVSPDELEAVLVSHEAIADAAVIGLEGDEIKGQKLKAFVVKAKGFTLTEHDIHAFMKEHVAPFKQLTGGVEFSDSIPRTATGKIQRKQLYEYQQKITKM